MASYSPSGHVLTNQSHANLHRIRRPDFRKRSWMFTRETTDANKERYPHPRRNSMDFTFNTFVPRFQLPPCISYVVRL